MFCKNCGKEIKGENKFCPYCGEKLQLDERKKQLDKPGIIQKVKSYAKRREVCIGIVALIVIFVVGTFSGKKDVDGIVKKMETFTGMEKTDTGFTFSTDMWSLKYVESNEFVEFSEDAIYKCFINYFGTYDLGNEGTFTYDLSENEIRIYFDCEISEGRLTIINYDISSDEFVLMVDGKKYTPTDEFVEFLNNCSLSDIMKNDIVTFETELKENGISIEEVTDLKYKDLVKYFD